MIFNLVCVRTYLWLTQAQLNLNFIFNPNLFPENGQSIFTFEEALMFEVTDLAVNNLKAYLEQNKISSAVRIALMQGG